VQRYYPEKVDTVKVHLGSYLTCMIVTEMDQLTFQGGKKALYWGMVVNIIRAAHA